MFYNDDKQSNDDTLEALFLIPDILYSALFFGSSLLIADVLVVVIFGPKKLVREAILTQE